MTEVASERQKLYLSKKISMIELNVELIVRSTTLILLGACLERVR